MKKIVLKITNPLLLRVVIFLCFFVLTSGLIGTRIISGGILFKDGFGIYGGLGKAAIFGLIAFALLVRHKGFAFHLKPWQPILLGWAAGAFAAFIVAWLCVDSLLVGDTQILTLVGAHAGLIISVACIAVACIGLNNIWQLGKVYRRELLCSAVIAGVFYIFLQIVYALWQPLAGAVLESVHGLLALINIPTTVIPPNILLTDKFGITVAESCSGIESIALFSGLYIIVGLLDRERLNVKRYLWVFPIALAALFAFNIVRVFALIAAGYYINEEFAFSLFHTYAGLIFFILYSVVFWVVVYKHLLLPKKKKHEDTASN